MSKHLKRLATAAAAAILVSIAGCASTGGSVSVPPVEQHLCDVSSTKVIADTTGQMGASLALQSCADANGRLDLPKGVYKIDKALIFQKPLTINGAGATWIAAHNITGVDNHHPMVTFPYTPGAVVIDGLTLDGNFDSRKNAWFCNGTTDAYAGGNILIDHVDNVVIKNVTTQNAVCGSGMHFWGDNATIISSTFAHNGYNIKNQWADGLTLLHCSNCNITNNNFINNSDVGLVFGGGTNTLIAHNTFTQTSRVFAALSMDNFNNSTSGDFSGSVYRDNTINCNGFHCDFGINLGPGAWYPSNNTIGGTVINNKVHGAKIGILAASAGTAQGPVTVYDNVVTGSVAAEQEFNCGPKMGGDLLRSANSVLNTAGRPDWKITDHRNCP